MALAELHTRLPLAWAGSCLHAGSEGLQWNPGLVRTSASVLKELNMSASVVRDGNKPDGIFSKSLGAQRHVISKAAQLSAFSLGYSNGRDRESESQENYSVPT